MHVHIPQEKSRNCVDFNFEFLDELLKKTYQEHGFENWETVCVEVDNISRQVTLVGYSESVEKFLIAKDGKCYKANAV
jgi:hypothetical protein